MAPSTNRLYWAAEPESKRFCARARERFSWCQAQFVASGRLERAVALLSAYYGHGTTGDEDSSCLVGAGEIGELTKVHVNGVAPIVTNIIGLIAGERPAVKPVATNGDDTSSAQARIASQLHDYYDRRDGAPDLELSSVRGGVLATAWWIVQSWLAQAGDVYELDAQGQPVYEGDLLMHSLPPWRVAADPIAHSMDARKWLIFQRRASRWDLAARIKDPYVREKVERGTAIDTLGNLVTSGTMAQLGGLEVLMGETAIDEDACWVWEVRHLPTPALPNGRLVQFVNDECVLFDSMAVPLDGGPVVDEMGETTGYTAPTTTKAVKYPYDARDLHAYEYSPERVVGSSNGHSASINLLGLQEFMDVCTTSIATSVDKQGLDMLWGGGGEPTKPFDIGRGIQVIDTPTKPEAIELRAVKPEVVEIFGWVQTQMRLSGALNDTVMGEPPKGMPASAQALQRAQAVQFHQVAQGEYVRLVERVANGRLRILKRFAKSKRVAEIAGADGSYEVLEWQKDDIGGVERFRCEPVNPASRSFEARQAAAEFLAGKGLLSPEGFLAFQQTGNLEAELRPQTAWKELVERNKALLQRGQGLPPVDMAASQMGGDVVFVEDGQPHVRPLKSDPHHIAIPAYLSVANNPQVRSSSPLVVEAVLSVVEESMRLWQMLTPDECRAFGIPMLPTQEMQAAMAAAPPAPMPSSDAESQPLTDTGLPEDAGLPKPPPDPLTGEQDTTEELGGLVA